MSKALQRIREHEQRQEAARKRALAAARVNRTFPDHGLTFREWIERELGPQRKPRRWWEFWK